MIKEYWKEIPNYEGFYEISNLGNVRRVGGKILKGNLLRNRYWQVALSKNNHQKSFEIHRLMAFTFLNHKSSKFEIVVDHIDNNSLNNRLDNLQLVTHRYNNQKDKVNKNGLIGIKKTKFGKFEAKLRINRLMVHVGNFETAELAHERYNKAVENIDKYNGVPKDFRTYLNSI